MHPFATARARLAIRIMALLLLFAPSALALEPGVIGRPPPADVLLTVTTGPNGEPVFSDDAFVLVLGAYERFDSVWPDGSVDDRDGR